MNRYNILGKGDNERGTQDWELILKMMIADSIEPGKIIPKNVLLFKSLRIYQNNCGLKIELFVYEKINIKITNRNGSPVYLRRFEASNDYNRFEICTSGWDCGTYNIAFCSTAGINIAIGEFNIR